MSQEVFTHGSNASSSAGLHERIGPGLKYERQRLLGAGSFGEAWLVRSVLSNRHYVVKELKMIREATDKDQDITSSEVRIIEKCSHVNIVRYKESFYSLTHSGIRMLSIVMEYADGGDLHDMIKSYRQKHAFIEEAQIKNFFVQLTFAIHYLHQNNILHRDIKTQNIFLTSTKLVKLGDFGVSRTLSHENDYATTGIGTPQYLSPEVCQQRRYGNKSDMWGLGCVLYEMCALIPTFPGKDLPALVMFITRAVYKPIPSHFTINMAEFIKVLLRPDPTRRPSARQLLDSKVLQPDIEKYMAYVNSLPEHYRKRSSGSVSSADMPVFPSLEPYETVV